MKKPFSRNLSVLRRRTTFLPRYTFRTAGAFCILALLLIGLRVFIPEVLTAIGRPFWSMGTSVTNAVSSVGTDFSSKAALAGDRERLLNENAALSERNRTLEAQIADLTKLTGSPLAAGTPIIAGVLVHPPVSPYDTLIVDVGEKSGVKEGALVYGIGGVPLGTVESVSGSSARISLYSAPGRVNEGWVGDNRTAVSITGRGAGSFEASISHAAGITAGMIVYLPGPGALPIGTVVRVDSDPSSPRDTLHIAPYQSPFSLTWVSIAPHL